MTTGAARESREKGREILCLEYPMNRRTLQVNQVRTPSRRRPRMTAPLCPSVAPFTPHGPSGAYQLTCILDEHHGGQLHFADGFEWSDEGERSEL